MPTVLPSDRIHAPEASASTGSPRSTTLENIRFAPDGVSLEFDGREIVLSAKGHPEGVLALQGLYDRGQNDFLARARTTAHAAKPGWLARLRTWWGRVFGGRNAAGRESGGPGPASAADDRGEAEPMPAAPRARAPVPG
ncbi:MAG: hypothetical protein ACREFX_06400, partial [Opitutaceae bacterium]